MLSDTSLHVRTDTELRVGIIDLGHISRFHADRLLDHGVTLAGGMDTDSAAQARFAERHDAAVYDGLNRLFDVTDAVVIATPNCYHEQYAIAALDAGRGLRSQPAPAAARSSTSESTLSISRSTYSDFPPLRRSLAPRARRS